MSTATTYNAAEQHLPNGYSPSANGYTNGASHSQQPMESRQAEYPHPGSSPDASLHHKHPPETPAPAEQSSSSAQYSQPQVNSSAAPTTDYGLNPSSARSANFPPEYMQRTSYPDGSQRFPNPTQQGSATANMAQPSHPSIAAAGPAYSGHHYPPYPPQHEMHHYSHPPPGMYRPPEYAYAHPHPVHAPYGHPGVSGPPPLMSGGPRPPGGGHPLSTVYSFVPIPGTHQQKRPRRRYEEIERMYKCGWQGCEKAYGTLNHLNAHVTMQGHGSKRTPEEFKEIRKEWKARKKEEETQRKAEEERQRQQAVQQAGQVGDGQANSEASHTPSNTPGYQQPVRQLPPLGYAPASGQVPAGQYAPHHAQMDGGMPQYSSAGVPSYYPASPYGQPNQMYHHSHPPANGHAGAVGADS